MNQFKKAKQQAMKTGHYNESVTDLNTAGVVQTSSEPESVKKDSNKNTEEVKQSKSTKILFIIFLVCFIYNNYFKLVLMVYLITIYYLFNLSISSLIDIL